MTILEAVILGIVQGVTEFLPISSTAHLRIAPALLGWGDPGAAFSAIIQLGSVAAVVLFFWRDIVALARAFFQGLAQRSPLGTPESKLAWSIVIGTLPVAVVGKLFKTSIETSLRSLYVIAASMLFFAMVLFAVERVAKHRRILAEMTVKDGLFIGGWQALALIPGASRSGTTLTGGLSLGFKREDAARYSFLLSIPANTAAGIFQFRELLHAAERPSNTVLAVGTLVSFGVGMATIAGLLKYLRTRSTLVFVGYRMVMGLTLLGLLWSGALRA